MGEKETPVLVTMTGTEALVFMPNSIHVEVSLSVSSEGKLTMIQTSQNVLKIVNLDFKSNAVVAYNSKTVSVFCNICELMSKDNYDASKHGKLHQSNGEIFLCKKCSLSFTDHHCCITISDHVNTGWAIHNVTKYQRLQFISHLVEAYHSCF